MKSHFTPESTRARMLRDGLGAFFPVDFWAVFRAGPTALRLPLNLRLSVGTRGLDSRHVDCTVFARTSGRDLNTRPPQPTQPPGTRRFDATGYIGTIGLVARRGDTIELAVLGLLHEGPMHGYELRKRLNLMLGWGRVLSYGSLYPALKKMLRGALIEETTAALTPVT